MNILILIILLVFKINPIVLGSRFCQWSHETAVAVSSCPQNKSAMEERANIKNCEALARIQNCTVPENFKYHCVLHELETELVEVCAPQFYIHGFCTEYNSLGAAIQEHFSLKCSEFKPPCDTSYLSTNAYLYKGCYDRVRKDMFISSTVSTATEFSSDNGVRTTFVSHLRNDEYTGDIYFIIITLFVGLGIAIISCLIIKFRRRIASACKNVNKGANPAEEQFISGIEEKLTGIEVRT